MYTLCYILYPQLAWCFQQMLVSLCMLDREEVLCISCFQEILDEHIYMHIWDVYDT